MKQVTVVTNNELGWDCVCGVYASEEYARTQHRGEYTIVADADETSKLTENEVAKAILDSFDCIFDNDFGAIEVECIEYDEPTLYIRNFNY